MANRRVMTAASMLLALVVLLAGLLSAVPTAAGEVRGQEPGEVVQAEANTGSPKLEGQVAAGTRREAPSGPDVPPVAGSPASSPLRLLRMRAQQPLAPLAPGAVPLTYWIWIDSGEIEGNCGYDWGGVILMIRGISVLVDRYDLCEATNTHGWVRRTVDLSGFGGAMLVAIVTQTDSTVASSLFVDDVALGISGPGIRGFINGNFESGVDGSWQEYSTVLPIPEYHLILDSGWRDPVRPHSGNWAVWLGGFEAEEWTYIEQWIKLPYRVKLPIVLKTAGDPYEPNDTLTQAWGPLQSGVTYNSLFATEADKNDYYHFTLPAAHQIEAWLTNIPAGRDYALYLYDAAHVLVGYSDENGTLPEHVGPVAGVAARYYLRVERVTGGSSAQPYALRVVFR